MSVIERKYGQNDPWERKADRFIRALYERATVNGETLEPEDVEGMMLAYGIADAIDDEPWLVLNCDWELPDGDDQW